MSSGGGLVRNLLVANLLVLLTLMSLPGIRRFTPNVPFANLGSESLVLPRIGEIKLGTRTAFKDDSLAITVDFFSLRNLYEVYLECQSLELEAEFTAQGSDQPEPLRATLFVDYQSIIPSPHLPAELRIPISRSGVAGQYAVSLAGDPSARLLFAVGEPEYANVLLSRLPERWAAQFRWFPLLLIVLSVLFNSLTVVLETRLAGRSDADGRFALGSFVARMAVLGILIASSVLWFTAKPPPRDLSLGLLAVFGLSCLPISLLVRGPWSVVRGQREQIGESVPLITDDGRETTDWPGRLAVAVGVLLLVQFAYNMTLYRTFHWAIFEERDYLVALETAHGEQSPVLGPQLLAGGQTPGGFVYYLLAPVAGMSDSPEAFSIFNRVLYVAAAVLLWLLLWRNLGANAALFGLTFFCVSRTMLNYAGWPIHPSMSIPFYFLFLMVGTQFYVTGRARALAGAAILLSLLVQLHFSYLLLLPALWLLVAISPAAGKIRLFLLTVAGFLLPLLPYLVYEIATSGNNIGLILAQPRFHPGFIPIESELGRGMISVIFLWCGLAHCTPAVETAMTWGFVVLVIAGLLALAVLPALKRMPPIQSRATRFTTAFSVLFIVPFLLLLLSGWGYSQRHSIAFAPALVVLPAIALFTFGRLYLITRIGMVVGAAAFAVVAMIGISDKTVVRQAAKGDAEWAVDYRVRDQVADYLAGELHLTPEQYRQRVYWWWVGWSMDPVLYEKRYERHHPSPDSAESTQLAANESILVFSDSLEKGMGPRGPRSGPYFTDAFDLTLLHEVGGVRIFRARHKHADIVVANSVNQARLSAREFALETADVPLGIARAPLGDGDYAWLLSLHRGRIRLCYAFDAVTQDGVTSVSWKCESPHLCGYYQEIKTVWKPYIRWEHRVTGESVTATIGYDVLGSLLYKTPCAGQVQLHGDPADWRVFVGRHGYFDQSSMKEPVIEHGEWEIP